MYILRWVRKHPNKARVFLLHSRDELMSSGWPESLQNRAEHPATDLDTAIAEFTARHHPLSFDPAWKKG